METISWSRDAFERVAWTVVQVLLATFLTAVTEAIRGTEVTDLDAITAALLAGWGAVAALVKAWVAKFIEGTVTPASTAKKS